MPVAQSGFVAVGDMIPAINSHIIQFKMTFSVPIRHPMDLPSVYLYLCSVPTYLFLDVLASHQRWSRPGQRGTKGTNPRL